MERRLVSRPDFDEFCEWISERRANRSGSPLSKATLTTRRTTLVAVCKLTQCYSLTELAYLLTHRAQVESLLALLGQRMTRGAVRSYVFALRDFGDFATYKQMVRRPIQLYASDMPPRNRPKVIHVYSEAETAAFVDAARGRGLRWWAFMATLVDTGRRVSEVLSFEWERFRLETPPVYVELPVTKTGDAQYVPLPSRLRNEVFTPENIAKLKAERRSGNRRWNRDPEKYPFPWAYTTAYNMFSRFCEKADLPNRGFHNFRHTVITARIAQGMPIQAVAALAGHATPSVTLARYSHATALDYIRYVE